MRTGFVQRKRERRTHRALYLLSATARVYAILLQWPAHCNTLWPT